VEMAEIYVVVLILLLLTSIAFGRAEMFHQKMDEVQGQTLRDKYRKQRGIWDALGGISFTIIIGIVVCALVFGIPDRFWTSDGVPSEDLNRQQQFVGP
jgi:hypothetical protein